MAYTKQYNPDNYTKIQDILDRMVELKFGEAFTVSNLVGNQVDRVRWAIYDWMHHMDMSDVFTIKTGPEGLLIARGKKLSEMDLNYVIGNDTIH